MRPAWSPFSEVSPPFRAASSVASPAARSMIRRYLVGMAVTATALGSLVLGGFFGTQAASAAATAPAAAQCDPPAFPTGAGFQVTCTITIDDNVSSAGATSSTVTATACLAAAGVTPPSGCTTTVTTSNQLVSSVNQCNGIVVGGGSNLTCDVSVIDTVPTGAATPGVTVNQCIGSGTGGGTQPTLLCTPVASTTNAVVTQCNGSGNGGGASTRVQCTVTGATTAEPITINQCNGSSNGGGSTVTCATTFTNNFVAAAPTTTTTSVPAGAAGGGGTTTPVAPAAGGATGGAGSVGGATGGAGSVGSGVTGVTGAASGAGGSTGSLEAVIPVGSPQTGFGGAAHAHDDDLLWLAVVALAGAGNQGSGVDFEHFEHRSGGPWPLLWCSSALDHSSWV
jgi:hypothetical protein